jgi:periplasmic protein TonB
MKYLLLFAFMFTGLFVKGHDISIAQDTTINNVTYSYVEEMPRAGYDTKKFLAEHLKYPKDAQNSGIEGRVTIKFLVNEDGTISDCMVTHGIGGGCDEEALRVIGSMPAWHPGKQHGANVKVWFMMPIVFTLTNPQ